MLEQEPKDLPSRPKNSKAQVVSSLLSFKTPPLLGSHIQRRINRPCLRRDRLCASVPSLYPLERLAKSLCSSRHNTMCHRRLQFSKNVVCSHLTLVEESTVDCGSPGCALSAAHSPSCPNVNRRLGRHCLCTRYYTQPERNIISQVSSCLVHAVHPPPSTAKEYRRPDCYQRELLAVFKEMMSV